MPLMRPSLSPIGPFLTTILIIVSTVKKKYLRILGGFLFLVISLSPVFIWTYGNGRLHGIRAFQIQRDIGILGRIMKDNIPIEGGQMYPFFYNGLTEFKRVDKEMNPFKFIKEIDPLIHMDSAHLVELQGFVQTIMRKEPVPYAISTLKDYPNAFLSLSPEITQPSEKNRPFATFLKVGQTVSRTIQGIIMILFLLTAVRIISGGITLLTSYIKHKGMPYNISIYEGILFTSSFLLLFTSLLLGYEDFARLSAPVMPVIISVSVWTLYALIKSIKFKIH